MPFVGVMLVSFNNTALAGLDKFLLANNNNSFCYTLSKFKYDMFFPDMSRNACNNSYSNLILTYKITLTQMLYVAKCNLGKVNLESMHPAVFLTNMHAGWPQGFALPCADESAVFAICSCFAIIVVLLNCFASKFTTLPLPPLLEVSPR